MQIIVFQLIIWVRFPYVHLTAQIFIFNNLFCLFIFFSTKILFLSSSSHFHSPNFLLIPCSHKQKFSVFTYFFNLPPPTHPYILKFITWCFLQISYEHSIILCFSSIVKKNLNIYFYFNRKLSITYMNQMVKMVNHILKSLHYTTLFLY